MNLQDKERIIKAFDDAITYEENFRPFNNGKDYFEAHYGHEPIYTKKVISLFGNDNCTLKIRQKPALRHSFIEEGVENTPEEIEKVGRDLLQAYENAGNIKTMNWVNDNHK